MQNSSSSITSLLQSGTKLWLDSVDPNLTSLNRDMGATGATSNPIIISELLSTGRFDDAIKNHIRQKKTAEEITWAMTDMLVSQAEAVFNDTFKNSNGNDGYVSFELDPLLEAQDCQLPLIEKIKTYVDLAKKWHSGHPNRMIKIPATPAGLGALEDIAALGIPLNVTLIFSERQYLAARDSVWRGAKRLKDLSKFKSCYSIFVSRIDVYTEAKYPQLSQKSQGFVGIYNAKKIWSTNHSFWKMNPTPLQQEIIFASTGTKKSTDLPWKYVAALAGSDIQTNPPATNDAIAKGSVNFTKEIFNNLDSSISSEIEATVDWNQMETDLMHQGLSKFADPHKALINLVKGKFS